MSELHSEELDKIGIAMVNCQAEIHGAVKNSKNPHFKSDYADLASVWDAVRVPMTENGLSVIQTVTEENLREYLITTLLHVSGQWFKSKKYLKPGRTDNMQGDGSAITYARRYCLAAIMGVPQVDDDGNDCSSSRERKRLSVEKKNPTSTAKSCTDRPYTEKELPPIDLTKIELVKEEDYSKDDLLSTIKETVKTLVARSQERMDWIKKTYEIPEGADDLEKKDAQVLKEILRNMQSLDTDGIDELINREK